MNPMLLREFFYYGNICMGILGLIIMIGYAIEGDSYMVARTFVYVTLSFAVFLISRKMR